jgi:endo-1,4-beta-D-glucanase Y
MTRSRRPALKAPLLALGLLLAAPNVEATVSAACGWPAWDGFKAHLLSADGRVIDASAPRQHTVSEGQAYALFFALVADDRASFERILQWTENNLAQGDFTAQLPAWQWGRRDDSSWGVLDANPASDADVWIAYTLGEAGRLWQQRRYSVDWQSCAQAGDRADSGPGPDPAASAAGFHPGEGSLAAQSQLCAVADTAPP